MVRLISRQRGGLAALKMTKLFGIDDFLAAKDSGKVLIIIIYCYLIIIFSLYGAISHWDIRVYSSSRIFRPLVGHPRLISAPF